MKHIAIIGGGAAGMLAAIVAKRNGSKVTIVERNDRMGKKILATGNGRCNYTNISLDIENFHGENPKFAYPAISSFNQYSAIDFFEQLGIVHKILEGGKVFPMSLQSSSVLDVLRYEIEKLNIGVEYNYFASEIKKDGNNFYIFSKENKKIKCDKVIIATGGMAMPQSGSDGNGYKLVEKYGHKKTKIFQGLVQLKLDGNIFKGIKGVKVLGKVSLYSNNILMASDEGDILFTDYGISGPPILQLSRRAMDKVIKGEEVEIRVAIIGDYGKEDLREYLKNRSIYLQNKNIEDSMIGLINKKLINPILKETSIDKEKKLKDISELELDRLSEILTSWTFKVTGSQTFGQAQVTAGGIDTKDINSKTMESKLVKGIYLIGEILDIDGDCGGYNLQWAWSSAYMAASDASLNN